MTKVKEIIVFVPNKIQDLNDYLLIGEVEDISDDGSSIFYALHVSSDGHFENVIGWLTSKKNFVPNHKSYVSITREENNKYYINGVQVDGRQVNLTNSTRILLILYDEHSFSSCEVKKSSDDIFYKLKSRIGSQRQRNRRNSRVFSSLLTILSYLALFTEKLLPLLKYSAIGIQFNSSVNRLLWAVTSVNKNPTTNVKIGNLMLSVFLDVVLGWMCLNLVLSWTSADDFPGLFQWTAETCVMSLKNLLHWLRGSPAGFKLNREFNNILAQFYLFHTEIWWMFLTYISPYLRWAFEVFVFLGRFGLTFQAAILSDILGIVTFHVYCIYAYAARLYNIQLSGLKSLWRLFLGRKWNPLREKVDSCQYTPDQLFVGTLSFTILLFLLPTTLIYYIVFATSRVIIVAAGGTLTRICMLLHIVPVYSTFLWLIKSPAVSTQIHVETNASQSSPGVLVVEASLVPDSYVSTVVNTVPDCISIPPTEPFHLISPLLSGKLLYPV